jgi:dolichol-phosphate mannosyltransferase
MTTKVQMVSVIIPTLNEAGNIQEALNTIHEELAYPNEIIVVDGNSTDGTIDIVKDTNFCRLIIEPRRGYGLALRKGMKEARGDINRLLKHMTETDAELCMATRMYDPNKAMGFMNFVGNKIITFCFDFVYQQFLSDSQSGFRAISHSAIEKVEFKESDMAFATEMLVQFAKKGFKMVEVKSIYKPRKYGKTKLRKFKSGIEIFTTMLKGFTR